MDTLENSMAKQARMHVKDQYEGTDPINLAWHAMQVNVSP
jgi:hypothetical protein